MSERVAKAQVQKMWHEFIVEKLEEAKVGERDVNEIATEIVDEFVNVMEIAVERLTGKKPPQ